MAKSLGVAPFDVDGDGLVDLAVANDTVPNFLFHNLGGGQVRGDRHHLGHRLRPGGLGPRGDGHRLGRLQERRHARPGHRQLRQRDDRPLRHRRARRASSSPTWPTSTASGAPTQPPLKFGLFFFDYDLDGRLDLLSANGHLESDIAKVQASETYAQSAQLFWNTGQPGRVAVRPGRPRRRPAPTCSGRSSAGAAPTPTSTATATSTSSSPPTAAPPASSATTATVEITPSACGYAATNPIETASAPGSSCNRER